MLLTAFIFYAIAAFQLNFFALSWIKLMTSKQIFWGLILGIPIGVLKYFLVFQKPNKKNYLRIINGSDEQKLFHVFSPPTYIIVVGMITLGLSLRLVFDVARYILMPVYLAIGIALLGSFLFYLWKFFEYKNKDSIVKEL